jgi:hypothetical protein
VSRPLISQNMARSPNATRTRVPMKPLQLHFHTRSEHLVGGAAGAGWGLGNLGIERRPRKPPGCKGRRRASR